MVKVGHLSDGVNCLANSSPSLLSSVASQHIITRTCSSFHLTEIRHLLRNFIKKCETSSRNLRKPLGDFGGTTGSLVAASLVLSIIRLLRNSKHWWWCSSHLSADRKGKSSINFNFRRLFFKLSSSHFVLIFFHTDHEMYTESWSRYFRLFSSTLSPRALVWTQGSSSLATLVVAFSFNYSDKNLINDFRQREIDIWVPQKDQQEFLGIDTGSSFC